MSFALHRFLSKDSISIGWFILNKHSTSQVPTSDTVEQVQKLLVWMLMGVLLTSQQSCCT